MKDKIILIDLLVLKLLHKTVIIDLVIHAS
jgi:hypothetical protein